MEIRLRNVAIDCNDLPAMTRFWSELLSYEVLFQEDESALLAPDPSGRPRIFLQNVSEPRTGKNRLHMDLDVSAEADLDAAVRRAEALGARRVESFVEREFGWWVMADPEGNLFCVAKMHEE